MKSITKLLLITLLLPNIFCDDNDNNNQTSEDPLSGLYIILNKSSSEDPAGWYHDGEFFSLSDSSPTAPSSPYVYCAAIDGANLYIGGAANSSDESITPGYWTNGEWKYLDEDIHRSVTGIAASNNNIYGIISPNYFFLNDSVTQLDTNFSVRSFCGDASDIYIGGRYNNKPAYYHNGEYISLALPDDSLEYTGSVTGICKYNSDIYACGSIYNSQVGNSGGYWKNGEWIPIDTLQTGSGVCHRIVVNNNGIYIAASADFLTPGLWHDSVWTPYDYPDENITLENTYTGHADLTSLVVTDTDVYISADLSYDYESGDEGHTYTIGGYYKNGEWTVPDVDCDGEACYQISVDALVYQ